MPLMHSDSDRRSLCGAISPPSAAIVSAVWVIAIRVVVNARSGEMNGFVVKKVASMAHSSADSTTSSAATAKRQRSGAARR